jgi:hypothetical protein
MNIITGEKMQFLADVYFGSTIDYFLFNPAIGINDKNFLIKDIPEKYNNPKIIYSYTHCLLELYDKFDCFMNNFILISGNSDENIIESKFKKIAEHPRIIKWFSQNVCFIHPKLEPFSIGIANEQWEHGNSKCFSQICDSLNLINKTKDIFFNFTFTSPKRNICYDALKNSIEFLPNTNPIHNFNRLSEYKFAICPEGNGVDTHRLAECWYLKVVPIVVENDFINTIRNKIDYPIIILKDWNEILNINLDYSKYIFDFTNKINNFINLNYYKEQIKLLS